MNISAQLMTVAAFQAFRELPENRHKHFELIRGEIIEMPSPKNLHNLIAFEIAYYLRKFNLEVHSLGYVLGDNTDYILSEDTLLKPDASFVSFDRVTELPDYFEFAPDLAVEVISPSNTEREIRLKTELYFEHGGRMVWVIYPEEKTVYVMKPAPNNTIISRKLTVNDVLDGGDILTGFQVPVRDIFPKPLQ
jgi:Uma2 family endonuclease